MKYAVTQDGLKLRNLKNKTLLRHPNSHLPQPTDNTLPNAAQDAVSLFVLQGCIAGSCSTDCPPGLPGGFWQSAPRLYQ